MANNPNKRPQQQSPVSVSFEIGQPVELPSGQIQIPVKVITMSGDVRKPWTLNEIAVNGQILAVNAQTTGLGAEYGVMYPLPPNTDAINVSARYYNGKSVVTTENTFPVLKPEQKEKKAVRIELGQPFFSQGHWIQNIKTVTEDGALLEAIVYMSTTIETFACLNGDNTTTQKGTSFCFSVPDGMGEIWLDSRRWYFEVSYSLPGGVSPVKQQYLQPE